MKKALVFFTSFAIALFVFADYTPVTEEATVGSMTATAATITTATITTANAGAVTASGNITANGNIIGDDSTVITNMATLYIDTIEEDGTGGVAIEGLTLNDGVYTDADGALTISNLTVNGTATLAGGMTTNFNVLTAAGVTGLVTFTSGVLTDYDDDVSD